MRFVKILLRGSTIRNHNHTQYQAHNNTSLCQAVTTDGNERLRELQSSLDVKVMYKFSPKEGNEVASSRSRLSL